VLTLDVTGSYGAGRPAPVVLDARNAERVTVRLHRVQRPADLLWVTNRIGNDFIFRDHGLHYELTIPKERIHDWPREKEHVAAKSDSRSRDERPANPFSGKPVWEAALAVADLKMAPTLPWERR